jgi:site-specific recombinase XerD
VEGCTSATLVIYQYWITRYIVAVGDDPNLADLLKTSGFLSTLQESGLSDHTRHQALRNLRTFFRFGVRIGALKEDPTTDLTIRLPKQLPDPPTDEELRAILKACTDSFEGIRNRASILVMSDAGLRRLEVLRLLVQDWDPTERATFVRSGKGRKDRVVFVNPTTARAIRRFLGMRPLLTREDYLFVDRENRPLKPRHLHQILHRLSARAGLSPTGIFQWVRRRAKLELSSAPIDHYPVRVRAFPPPCTKFRENANLYAF